MCRQVGLQKDDLDDMTIGMCLDFMDEYIESKNPKEAKAREASQADFDSF